MTENINHMFEQYKVGDDKVLTLATAEQNRDASIALVNQARYTLYIVSRELDHKLYDNDGFYNTVKQLATSNPKAKIRILIQNSDKAVKQGHRLIDLSRKLSSFITIRLQGKHFKEFNEAWLIVDSKAWIRRAHADKYSSDVDYSAAQQLREIEKTFTNMWDESIDDPNLRRLSL